VKIHAGEAESRRNQRGGGLSVVAKSFSVQEYFGIELPGAPTGEHLAKCGVVHSQQTGDC
jgi:hypothetical protein